MNKTLMMMLRRYMAPAAGDEGGGGTGGTGTTDRGDDFVPADDDAAAADAAAAAAAAAAAGTKTELTDEEAEAERARVGLAAGKAAQTDEEKAAAAAAAAAAKDGKGKDTRIPLNRHTEILNRERAAREAAELEVKRLREGAQVVKTNEDIAKQEDKVTELEGKYTELMAEGKTKEAAALMKDIRQTERAIIEQKAAFANQVATAQAVEQVRFDTIIERLEEAYPQIKPGSDTYDKELVAEILEMQGAWVAKGYAPSAALQKAVGYIIKPTTGKQSDATTVTPRVSTEDAAQIAADARAAEQRKANAKASDAQPPALGKTGANSDAAGGVLDAKVAIKMPFDKFVKLSEDDLSRMRGDTV